MFSCRSIHASESAIQQLGNPSMSDLVDISFITLNPPKKKTARNGIRLGITNITFINPSTPSHYCFFCHLHNVRLCRVLCPPSSSSSISPRNAIHITTRNIPDGFLIHEVSVSRCMSYHHQLAKSNPSLVMPRSVECWE